MTVMPSGSDVADKAVSTEDASSGGEVVRLEAVLAALVETKVEAMKASSTANKKSGSAPPSPRRPRLTSSSTVSSSQNHHRPYHHHHHHHHHQQRYHHRHRDNERMDSHGERHPREAHERDARQHRRHDSAPCGDYIEDPTSRDHRKQRSDKTRRRRASEMPPNLRKKRRYSKSPNVLRDVNMALDSRFELLDIDGDQDLALINFERSREALAPESCDYPGIHQSACYFSHSAAHLKIHYDHDDYVALNLDDAFEDEVSVNGRDKREDKRERFHRPRRKKKRKKRIVERDVPEEEYVDPEELPPRARWTIIATACLLLAMSLLLVGVTLRMAPIIDDMGDGRRASVCRKGPSRRASNAACATGTGSRRKDSVRPTTRIEIRESKGKIVVKSPLELEQARRHRRIGMIIMGTFSFLLMASILAVVVTLTHSSFHTPPIGSKELAEHRANLNYHPSLNDTLRKENEELLNSLNQDNSLPENSTTTL